MVNLTRIYTRLGDDGTTHLADMSRVPKDDPRVQAYADVDEANAAVGLALTTGQLGDGVREILLRVQNDLFDVGADLSTPVVSEPKVPPLRITQAYVDQLEGWCDAYNETLAPLRSFVLPGGTVAAAHLHLARTVVRRAERSAWTAVTAHPTSTSAMAARYLNRLSDLLFILARHANLAVGDVLWRPGGATDGATDGDTDGDTDGATDGDTDPAEASADRSRAALTDPAADQGSQAGGAPAPPPPD